MSKPVVATSLVLAFGAGFGAAWRWKSTQPAPDGSGFPDPPTREVSKPRASSLTEAEAFFRKVDAAQLPELQAMWQEIANDESAGEFDYRLAAIVERHAELDPAGAVEFVGEQDGKAYLLTCAFSVWARNDPDSAIAALEMLSPFDIAAARGVVEATGGDPARMLRCLVPLFAAIGKESSPWDLPQLLSAAELRRMFISDPEGCREAAKELPPWAQAAIQGAELAIAAQSGPDAALDLLESLKPDPEHLGSLVLQLVDLAKSSPGTVADILAKVNEMPGLEGKLADAGYDSDQVYAIVLRHFLEQDPDRAGLFLRNVTHGLDRTARVYGILRHEMPEKIETALRLGPLMQHYDYISNFVASHFPVEDPVRALNAAREAPPSAFRNGLVTDAITLWQRTDPGAAEAWLAALPAGEFRKIVEAGVDSPDRPYGLPAFEQFGIHLRYHPNDPDAVALAVAAARNAVMEDPAAAGESVLLWPAGEAQDASIEEIGARWSSEDRPAAVEWMELLPDTSARAAAAAGVARGWTESEPIAASEWVAALEPGPVREAAVDSFSGALTERDPEAALMWAATLTDESRRSSRLDEVARHWLRTAPDAAQETIDSLPSLSPDDRARLQSLSPP